MAVAFFGLGIHRAPDEELFADDVHKALVDPPPRGVLAAESLDLQADCVNVVLGLWHGLHGDVLADAQVERSQPDIHVDEVPFAVGRFFASQAGTVGVEGADGLLAVGVEVADEEYAQAQDLVAADRKGELEIPLVAVGRRQLPLAGHVRHGHLRSLARWIDRREHDHGHHQHTGEHRGH